jgi:CrcB protein
MTALLVAAGACLGAPMRLLLSRAVADENGTLLVNVLGSLLLGVFAGLSTEWYALLGVGFCGAFTTYSTFAVEVVTLRARSGLRHVTLSVVLCCLACGLGLAVSG